jgi:hypothetical protein
VRFDREKEHSASKRRADEVAESVRRYLLSRQAESSALYPALTPTQPERRNLALMPLSQFLGPPDFVVASACPRLPLLEAAK